MHLLIDLKSPEYLNLPQHLTVSRTLHRAPVLQIIKVPQRKKGKFVTVHKVKAFSTTKIDGGEWLASHHGCFMFKENASGTI
jgi:hypothetical protein